MNLKDMNKEDLELLSYTKIAKMYLCETKEKLTTSELFKKICRLLDLTESDYQNNIADFFESLTTSKDFILLSDGCWDLKSNHKIKLDMDEVYDDRDDEIEEYESLEEINNSDNEEEENNIDDYDSIDEDYDDDLADLTIIDDDEIEN